MEICILEKRIINNFSRLFIILFVFFVLLSCSSNSYEKYERPDYTDSEIIQTEIRRIEAELDKNPVDSLWRTYLLYISTKDENVEALYSRCVRKIQSLFDTYVGEEKWFEAIKLADSLFVLNDYSDSLKKTISDEFFDSYNTVKTNYNNIVQLKKSTENSIPTLITGVVTIWVDLGVKVQKGVGFANRSIGSGFFIDERGYIITNHHVIEDLVDTEYEGYGKLYIKLSHDNKTRIPAKVVGWDKTLDLALLKTEVTPPYVFSLGSSESLQIGNQIYAIGSPVGLENTITSGIVSTFDRNLLYTASVMQIDAAVNPGNSGGPLISTNGDVQGIVFAGLPEYQGLNFAIPIEYLQSILLRLYSGGEVVHSWIGAYGKTVKKYPSDINGLGVEVLYVMPGGSANLANITVGTIITSFNGTEISSIEDLQFALIHASANTISTIGVKEAIDSEEKILPIYVDSRPEYPGYEIYRREPAYKMVYPIYGMELIPSSVKNNKKFTVQSIVQGSIADEASFSVHDPVEIREVEVSKDKDQIYIETFTKKRKNGYFEVNIGLGAYLDSSFIF